MVSHFTLKFIRGLATAATVLGLAGSVWALPQAQFLALVEQFQQARQGNNAAIDQSAEGLVALLATEPTHPVLMAYAGAATALRATTTWLPWKKMHYAEDGLAMNDKALALLMPAHSAVLPGKTPATLEVRFVVANTFLAVPGFMNRNARGAKLLAEVLASPLLLQSPLGFQGAVWLRAAQWAQAEKRPNDARQYLLEVIKHKAPQADLAQAQLKALAS